MKKFLIVLLVLICLSGCKKEDDKPQNTQNKEDQVMTDDVLKYREMFGKTDEELGLKAEIYSASAAGKAFGVDCTASLMFTEDLPDGHRGLSQITIYFKNSNFPDAVSFFEEEFKGSINAGMEPYVAVNGGAVEWFEYEDENCRYTYSCGSNNDYFSLSIVRNENPGFTGNLILGKFKGLESNVTDRYETKLNSYDNGILTVTIRNKTDEDMLLDNLMLYEMKDDGYYSMFIKGMRLYNDEINLESNSTNKLSINLRRYGKLEPNQYIVKYGEVEIYFALKEDK